MSTDFNLNTKKFNLLQNARLIGATSILIIIFTGAIVISLDWAKFKVLDFQSSFSLAGGVMGLTLAAFFMLLGYSKYPSNASEAGPASNEPSEGDWEDLNLDGRLLTLEADIISLKVDNVVSSAESHVLIAQISKEIKEQLSQDAEAIADFKRSEKALAARRSTILSRHKSSLERLSGEITAVRNTGTINLLIGGIIAFAGMITLAIVVLSLPSTPMNTSQYAMYFIPRMTLAFFIQLFAYFFLSLYKKAHAEIATLHNEMTNLELKFIALRAVIDFPEKTTYEEVVRDLIKTERNSVLKKGETTVELEIARSENSAPWVAVEKLSSIAKIFVPLKKDGKDSAPEDN